MTKRRTIRARRNKGPDPSRPRTRKDRKRLTWALGAGVILCVVLAGVGLWRRGRQDRQAGAPGSSPVSAGGTLSPAQEIERLKTRQTELAEQVMRDLPSGDACILMGNLHRRLGRSAEAVEYWRKGLEQSPGRIDVYHSLGMVAVEKGDFEQAIRWWRTTLEKAPQTAGLRRVIGQALNALGRYEEAITTLQEEIAISPQCAESHFLLGEAFLQQQDHERAKAYYEKAVELQPKYVNAWYGLATACARLGDNDRAEQCRRTFAQLRAGILEDRPYGHSPAHDLARVRTSLAELSREAAMLYRAAGRTAPAEQLLKQAVALDPNEPASVRALAAFYQATGRLPEALAQCERVRQLEPNEPACHLLIGTLALQLRQADRAEAAFRRFIALCPNESAGYRELAGLYVRTGTRLAEARTLASKAVALEPSAESYFILGLACRGAGDRPAALEALRKAVELAPTNHEFRRTYDLLRNER